MKTRLWSFVCGLFVLASVTATVLSAEDAPKPDAAKTEVTKPEAAKPDAAKPAAPLGAEDFVLLDTVQSGHSQHGEAFNEGPRQSAYLMEGIGKVNFLVTTNNPEAQKFFNQGVGQLHGFWYFEAERSFRQAAGLDPNLAMAYWGMALANTKNETRAKGFIAEAVKRKTGITDRETLYIDALEAYLKVAEAKNKERSLDYTHALEQILYKYPDDLEAKALLALQLWVNRERELPIASYLAVDALLGQILAVEPMHPVHHYRIHLWDEENTERALASAALCGPCSPGIAHMWHMPGHIYSGLRRYGDAVWQQEASARVDHAHMIRDRVLPDQIHNFAHNNEWLLRNLSHIGRVRDAIQLAENMLELPRHPKYNTLDKKGSTFYGRVRMFDLLTDYELWDDLIARAGTTYLEPTDVEAEQVKRLRFLGRAYFRKGDLEAGKQQLAVLEERLTGKKQLEMAAVSAAEAKAQGEGKDAAQIEKAKGEAADSHKHGIRKLETAITELRSEAAIATGDYKLALELLDKQQLLEKQQPLDKVEGLNDLYLAQARLQAGEGDEAEKIARKYVNKHKQQVRPLAYLVSLLWQRGKKPEATETFNQLREISAAIDLDLPVFARLAPIAAELGFPADWRVAKAPAADLGPHPALDSLGPFRWHPSAAPDWILQDVDAKEHSLKEYRGKPVILIFYLGYGCLHCAEQIQAFAPKAKEFAAAGISMVAISTDNLDGLKTALENYGEEPFPFKLVSDADLKAFRAYRVYDDFENRPLHGTLVIDSEGLVRWQDIGHEPFLDPDFVLKEALRQFSQTASKAALTAGTAPVIPQVAVPTPAVPATN